MNYNYVFDENLYKNKVFNIEKCYDFKQLITEPTRVTSKTSTLLDVLLTSEPECHVKSGVLKTAISDHNLIYSVIDVHSDYNEQIHTEITFRDYRNFNVEMFLNDVHNELYDKELAWDEWYSRFDSICNVHAPLASRRIKDSSKPWIDPEMTLKLFVISPETLFRKINLSNNLKTMNDIN